MLCGELQWNTEELFWDTSHSNPNCLSVVTTLCLRVALVTMSCYLTNTGHDKLPRRKMKALERKTEFLPSNFRPVCSQVFQVVMWLCSSLTHLLLWFSLHTDFYSLFVHCSLCVDSPFVTGLINACLSLTSCLQTQGVVT